MYKGGTNVNLNEKSLYIVVTSSVYFIFNYNQPLKISDLS